MTDPERSKSCCLWLFIATVIGISIGIKPGMMYQELLGYRKEAVLQDKARSMNVDVNNPRLGPIVDRAKHGH